MNIGTVVNLPVNNKDTSCIFLNKKTYGELRRERIDNRKFLDCKFGAYDEGFLYIFTFVKLYKVSVGDDEEVCYEFLIGDEKVWIRLQLLNKYVKMV